MNAGIVCFSAFFLGVSVGLLNSNLPKTIIPSKAKKKKKKKKAHKSSDLTTADSITSETSILKEPQELVDLVISTLSGIYQNDFIMISKPNQKETQFKIFLTPKLKLHEITCSLFLEVLYPQKYPQVSPVLKIKNPVGINDSVLNMLNNQLLQMVEMFMKLKKSVVFEACEWLKEELIKYNPTPPASPLVSIAVAEESSESYEVDLNRKVKQELFERNKVIEEPMMLNTVNNIKLIDKELSEEKCMVPKEITGFDYKSYFEQIELIGKGGEGSVFKVKNKIDECYYAVKIISLKVMKESVQLIKEVLVLASLQHQNIVRYHNAWFEENTSDDSNESEDSEESSSLSEDNSESGDWVVAFQRSRGSITPFNFKKDTNKLCKLFIQMEYCAGNSLHEVLNAGLPGNENAWKMLKEILHGLVYIHSRKIIHRDLKPSNIFLGAEGEVKLGDFGLAATNENKEDGQYAVGTPLYFSPEQEQGKYDQKSDIFALGIIFFEMWRGFGSDMQKVIEIKNLSKRHLLPENFEVPKEVREIILWMTEPKPENRPTAEQVLVSSHLPHQIDKKTFEEFLRVAFRPGTVEEEWLNQGILKQENLKHIEFTYNTTLAINAAPNINRRKTKVDSMIKTAVELRLKEVFINAGAVEINAPILYPYYKNFSIFVQDRKGNFQKLVVEHEPNAQIMRERSGIRVQLPDNAIVPWARQIAKEELGGIVKRFAIQNIYKISGNREHPKECKQASLDYSFDPGLYSQELKYWLQAELLTLASLGIKNILQEVTEVKGGIIELHVNDSRILDAILDYFEVRMDMRASVLKIIANFYRTPTKLTKEKLTKLGLNFSICEKMEHYLKLQGKLSDIKDFMKKQPIYKDKVLQKIINEDLAYLDNFCECFGLTNVIFNLSVVQEDILYYSGFLCRFVYKNYGANHSKKENYLLASGGCYDNLISNYTIPDKLKQKSSTMSGIGIIINYDTIISILLQSNAYSWLRGPSVFLNSAFSSSHEGIDEISRKKIELALKLWKSNISAIYNYNNIALDSIPDMCRRYKIRIYVHLDEKKKPEEKKEIEKREKPSESENIKYQLIDYGSKHKTPDEEKKSILEVIRDKVKCNVGVKLVYPVKQHENTEFEILE